MTVTKSISSPPSAGRPSRPTPWVMGMPLLAEDILTLLRHYEKGTKKGTPLMLGEVANSISLMLLEDTSVSELLALTPEVFAGRIHDISAEDLANTLEQLK